jgi:hypothetical protein
LNGWISEGIYDDREILCPDRWLNLRDRPNDWRRTSSIAATDWNTRRVAFTTKTPHAKTNRGNPAGREWCITFISRFARGGFADTQTYPQKNNG